MIIPYRDLSSVYDQLTSLTIGVPMGVQTILIIVGNGEVDGLCAARILQTLLKQDCIAHKLRPTHSYTDLNTIHEQLIDGNEELRAVVMINCGGLVDIVDYFKLDEEDDDEEEMDEYGNTSNTTTPKHKLKIFVIDSHRPLNLQNIYAVGSDQVVVLDDGDIEDMTHVKEAYDALLKLDEEGDSDGDDEEDDDDDDDIDEDGEESDDDNNEGAAKDKKKAKKKRLKGENGSGGEEEEDEDEDIDGEEDDEVSQNVDDEGTVADINNNNIKNHNAHDDENKTTDNENDDNNNANNNNDDDNDTQVQNDPSRKRKLNSAPTSPSSQTSIQSARKRKRNRRKQIYNYQQVIRSYYSEGTYHGMAASGLLYTMASQLGRCNNDMVWWAVIGLTDQFLHDRIQLLKYHDLVDNFKQEVNRFNHGVAGGGGHNNNSTNDVDDLLGSATLINSTDSMSDIVPAALRRRGIGGNASLAGPSVGSTGSRSADDDTITPEDEFRLYLLRHWNLNESMYHSTYVATNMGIWKEKGRSKLDNMLAKMGFPLKESSQAYSAMSLDFKKLMNTKLKQVAPRYNLPEILFPSFVRRYGYKTALSASDAVHSLTSLLDYGAKWVKSYVQMDLGDMVGDAGLSSSIAVGGTNREGAGGGIMSAIHHFSASAGIYSGADHVSTRGGSGGLQAGVGVGTRTGIAAVGARLAESADSMILGFSSSRRLEDGDKEEDQEDEWMQDWVRNFYVAYDALDSPDLMYCGVHLAMQFQRTLVRTGLSILDRFAVKLIANKFRFLILSPSGSASRSDGGGHTINKQQQHGNGAAAADSSTSSNNNNNNKGGDGKGAGYITNEYQIFSRSASHLLRLAQFLLLAIKQFRREEKNVGSSGGDKKDVNLPLVVAALNETSDTFLVIGLPPASKKLRKNPFGIAFQQCAERMGAQVKHDSFDTCVIEIKRVDVVDFIEQLRHTL